MASEAVPCTHVALSEFELTGRLIGSGSYSEVTLCIRHRGRQKYALKTISKEKAKRKNTIKYVLNEREVLIRLHHQYVLKLFHTSRDIHNVYMFFEYCEHGELWNMLRRYPNKIPPRPIALRWFAQVCLGLQHIHAHNIAHRDLKPENIFLTDTFDVRIGDFGTSKRIDLLQQEDEDREKRILESKAKFDARDKPEVMPDDEFESHRRKSILYDATRCDSFTGTPEYMAPETIHNYNTRGSAVDIWALGVFAYQLFTGKYPFKGDTGFLTFLEIDKMNVEYDTNVLSEVEIDFIQQLLRPDPSQRLGVYTAPIAKEDVKTTTGDVEHSDASEREWCAIRNAYKSVPLHKASVNTTPESWTLLLQHDLFKDVDMTNLGFTKEEQADMKQLYAMKIQERYLDLHSPTEKEEPVLTMEDVEREFDKPVDTDDLLSPIVQ